jgi:TetR/AcrR family transcriptional regulator, fatty acid biosynthesis regulator
VRVDPRKKEERERVAHELLRATLRLAAAHGFVSLGLREVSRAADIAPTSFYRYFADMEQLGLTLIDELASAFFGEWIGETDGKAGRATGSLDAIAKRAFAGAVADPELMRFVLAERFGAIPSFRAALERELAEVGAALQRACTEETPRSRPQPPPYVANAAVVFLLEACAQALDRGLDDVPALHDRFLRQVRAVLLGARHAEEPS